MFSSFPGAPSSVACDDRLVRDLSQPSLSRILLADGRSAVGGHGRNDAAVGWSSGLCLPSIRPSPARHREGPAISGVGAYVGGSVLASTPLVSGPSGTLVAVPVFLPRRKDLPRQPHFHRFHQNLPMLCLTAFRISSAPPAPSASLRQWLGSLPAADAPPL